MFSQSLLVLPRQEMHRRSDGLSLSQSQAVRYYYKSSQHRIALNRLVPYSCGIDTTCADDTAELTLRLSSAELSSTAREVKNVCAFEQSKQHVSRTISYAVCLSRDRDVSAPRKTREDQFASIVTVLEPRTAQLPQRTKQQHAWRGGI